MMFNSFLWKVKTIVKVVHIEVWILFLKRHVASDCFCLWFFFTLSTKGFHHLVLGWQIIKTFANKTNCMARYPWGKRENVFFVNWPFSMRWAPEKLYFYEQKLVVNTFNVITGGTGNIPLHCTHSRAPRLGSASNFAFGSAHRLILWKMLSHSIQTLAFCQ